MTWLEPGATIGTGNMEFRNQYGDLKYTGKRNDNGYDIRDSYGDLKWTEQSEE